MRNDINRCIEHILETNDIRRVFWYMDEKVDNLVYGIRQGDDAIVVGNTIINMEGPYPLKIGRKTGLIHTCSDIVVMGGKPLYALNSMQVEDLNEAKEVAEDIKKQSIGLNVPILGGNTQLESQLKPCISFTVIGELVDKPISDAGVREGDRILMLGDVVEGDIGERIRRANIKFNTFLEIIKKGVRINASKDASRGGWFGNLTEMLIKSRMGIAITSIPFSHIGRYMGNYLVSVPEDDIRKVIEISAKNRCPVVEVGIVKNEMEICIGDEILVDKKKMNELIRNMPYKMPRL